MSAKVVTNLDQLAEAIGSYVGMMEGLKQKTYMDELLVDSHRTTSTEFNRAAMAAAMHSKTLRHMYEFGTAGINDDGPSHYASGMSPGSRLWKGELLGGGGRRTISFTFLPAKKNNPPHDFEELGIDSSDAPPLKVDTGERTYKWATRASVVESGIDVHIKARWSKALFIPIKTEGMPAKSFGDPARGYVWAKSHSYSPGESSGGTGRFTTFFAGWWAKEGAEIMGQNMMNTVDRQLKQVEATIRANKTMKPVALINMKSAVEKGRRKTRKQWELKTDFDSGEGDMIL